MGISCDDEEVYCNDNAMFPSPHGDKLRLGEDIGLLASIVSVPAWG